MFLEKQKSIVFTDASHTHTHTHTYTLVGCSCLRIVVKKSQRKMQLLLFEIDCVPSKREAKERKKNVLIVMAKK